ncbi:MAG: endo-1,4-beta-xylanase [Chloroflexi bacterium]|nr:endo-1,4-beta-xylanase [Chloroflexota bacterium]
MKNFSRRQFLKAAVLAVTSACDALPTSIPNLPSLATRTPTSPPEPTPTPKPTATPTPLPPAFGLHERAKIKNLIFGAAMGSNGLADSAFKRKFAEECGILVPENELKWSTIRPANDTDKFDFSKADALYNFAKESNMLFRGHTLVWHSALPDWFNNKVTKQNAEAVLTQHITLTMAHFAGKMHSWDVVNEAIHPPDKRDDGLRKTKWLELLGDDYIETAFKAAASGDNKTLLTYNDFGVELDTPDHEAKRKAILKLLERLKTKKIPIHALGIQAHLDADTFKLFKAATFKKFLSDVSVLGLKIMITELDVTDQKLPRDVATRDIAVADAYKSFLSTTLDEPNVIAVLTWGLSDKYTWLTKEKPRSDGAKVRPLPLDEDFKRKLAWDAIAEVIDKAKGR